MWYSVPTRRGAPYSQNRLVLRNARGYDPKDLWELSKEGNAAQAEVALRTIVPKAPHSKKRMLYNTAIKAAANARDTEKAFRLYKEMAEEDIAPNSRTFGKLLNAAFRANDTSALEMALKSQKQAGFELDGITFSMLLKAVAQNGTLAKVEYWLRRFCEEEGYIPESHTYLTLVHSAARENDISAMERWLKHAMDRDIPLLSGVCSIVVDAYVRAGNPEAARRWFDWGMSAGSSQASKSPARRSARQRRQNVPRRSAFGHATQNAGSSNHFPEAQRPLSGRRGSGYEGDPRM